MKNEIAIRRWFHRGRTGEPKDKGTTTGFVPADADSLPGRAWRIQFLGLGILRYGPALVIAWIEPDGSVEVRTTSDKADQKVRMRVH